MKKLLIYLFLTILAFALVFWSCQKENKISLSDFIIGTWTTTVPNEFPIYNEITFTDSTYQLSSIINSMNGNDTIINSPVGYEINGNILILENLSTYEPPQDIEIEVPDQPIFTVVWNELELYIMTWKVDNQPPENQPPRGDIVWLRK